MLKQEELAGMLDHTNINPRASQKDIKKTCDEAKRYGFRGVDVNPKWVKFVSEELKGTGIKTIVLIDPPMGLSPHSKRVALCKQAKKDGTNELDVVMNIIDLKYERYNEVMDDLKEICKILPTKIIIGSGFLTDDEIAKASQIVKKAGAYCVKTATDKDPLENIELKEKARHLGLMAENALGLEIKASGKIKTLKDALMMAEAGATIIGTSSSVKIVQGFKKKPSKKKIAKKK